MNRQGLGTLASLAQILEEASNPESELREDKREAKPKTMQKGLSESAAHKKRVADPKRRAWYDRRLKEQAETQHVAAPAGNPLATAVPTQAATRSTAANASSGLLSVLASAKDAKPKDGSKKPEAWKRKPGDPIF